MDGGGVLTDYIRAAMRHARFKILDEDEGYFGEIPECPGVWANADTLEACRDELQEVLEGWVLLGLQFGDTLPTIDGIELARPAPAR